MKLIPLSILVCCLMSLISACNKGCKGSSNPEQISKIVGPRQGSVNQSLTYIVHFGRGGNGKFKNITQAISGNVYKILVNVSYPCLETMDLRLDSTTYTIKVSQPGTYIIKGDTIPYYTNHAIDTVIIN